MTEFKGTNGEWFVNGLFIECEGENGLTTVCQFYDRFGNEFEETESNAQLIATAPELLEALQETDKDLCILEGSMAQIEKVDKRAEGMTGLVKEWRARNKKAINKALGL